MDLHRRANGAFEDEHYAARRAGVDVTWIERAPLLPFDTGGCLRFPRQAQFHPLRYLAGLAEMVRHAGGKIVAGHVASKAHR